MPSDVVVFEVYIVVCCEQTCLLDSIRLGNRACFVFFSALTFHIFVFYLRSVGYIASYKIKLAKLTKLKILIPRSNFNF